MSVGVEPMPGAPATLRWVGGADGRLVLLDQTRLPREVVELECRTVEDVWQAIKRLAVRGAPAIGVAAAYGVCLAGVPGAYPCPSPRLRGEGAAGEPIDNVLAACDYLATSRPTAVNLFWALDRMRRVAHQASRGVPAPGFPGVAGFPGSPHAPNELAARLLAEARAIHAEDAAQCAAIGRHGADLLAQLPVDSGILTHCNAGALATAGEGTALAVIFELQRRGRRPHVWVDETRPLLQGSRLTAWELSQRGIRCTLICDSMAAQVMREGRVAAAIVGADRVAADGAAANKIGTYGVAVAAAAHKLPLYVAVPTSSFDLSLSDGSKIPIEQRAADEVTHFAGVYAAADNVSVYNPAFDVTPPE